ncbi:hypothetical protein FKM82_023281 [Ascaphus truei]
MVSTTTHCKVEETIHRVTQHLGLLKIQGTRLDRDGLSLLHHCRGTGDQPYRATQYTGYGCPGTAETLAKGWFRCWQLLFSRRGRNIK